MYWSGIDWVGPGTADYEFSALPYVVILFGIFLLCLLAVSVITLRDTDDDTWLVRAYIKRILLRSRLGMLLRKRGVNLMAYASVVPIPVIKSQLDTCGNCAFKAHCDRVLASKNTCTADFNFCPNTMSINRRLGPTQTMPVIRA